MKKIIAEIPFQQKNKIKNKNKNNIYINLYSPNVLVDNI